MARSSVTRILLLLATVAFLETFTTGFVLLFNPEARLPATLDHPEVPFVWDGKAPSLSGKDTYRGGVYKGQSDHDVMWGVINEATATWSNVPGSFVKLTVTEDDASLGSDPNDHINTIYLSKTGNLSAAATANPHNGHGIYSDHEIVDCDVDVNPGSVSVEGMLYILTHELGHCLGLGHAHDNAHSIMGYSRSEATTGLGEDDKAGLIYLYEDPAYGDPKAREAIRANCGVGGGSSGRAAPLVLLLLVPILALVPYFLKGIFPRKSFLPTSTPL